MDRAKMMAKLIEMIEELDLEIVKQVEEEDLFIVRKEDELITNMIIDLEPEDDLVVVEHPLGKLARDDVEALRWFLEENRELPYGALALAGDIVVFRNTHTMSTLDIEELENTIKSFSLFLKEKGEELLELLK